MILKVSTQYKKDLKRYQNKPAKIAALKEVLKHLLLIIANGVICS